jgi:MFS family permease
VLIITVTTVTSGCLLTVVGRLGDIFGRRYFLIGGQVFGVLGGIIGATAKSVNVLIGGSVFMGIAGAVQLTFTFVLCELVPNKHRAYVDAALFTSIIPFAAMGPAIGMPLFLSTDSPQLLITCPNIARLFVQNTAAGWRYFSAVRQASFRANLD